MSARNASTSRPGRSVFSLGVPRSLRPFPSPVRHSASRVSATTRRVPSHPWRRLKCSALIAAVHRYHPQPRNVLARRGPDSSQPRTKPLAPRHRSLPPPAQNGCSALNAPSSTTTRPGMTPRRATTPRRLRSVRSPRTCEQTFLADSPRRSVSLAGVRPDRRHRQLRATARNARLAGAAEPQGAGIPETRRKCGQHISQPVDPIPSRL